MLVLSLECFGGGCCCYHLMCLFQAFKLGMTLANGYTWILFAWYPRQWWFAQSEERSSYVPVQCTQSEIESVVEYAIIIDHYAFVEEANRDTITAADLVSCCLFMQPGTRVLNIKNEGMKNWTVDVVGMV